MAKPQTDARAVKEDVVQTRKLVDDPAAEDVKKLIDNFFLNQIYGAFSINVLADVFVRLSLLICTYLALLCCWKAKKREARLTEIHIQRLLDDHFENQRRYLRSDSYVRRVVEAATSDPQTSPAPAPSAPRSQVEVHSLGLQSSVPISQFNAGLSPASRSAENSTIAPPTEREKVVTRADQELGLLDQLPKRRNGFVYDDHIPDGSSSSALGSTSGESSASRCRAGPTQAQRVETFDDDVVIDILKVQGVFPSSASMETGNKFKVFMKDKVGVPCEHDISSSRIMQVRVSATDENLSALREVAVESMKLDKGFTLQIGGSFLYYCDGNPEEPVLVSLRDVEVPTVLQAEYSAGVMTITGKHLEGAEIRAATVDGYMILNCIKQDQINNNIPAPPERRIEVWRCSDLLPPVNLDQIQICASKTVLLEGHDVTVRSAVSSFQNTTLKTVIRNWVPTATLMLLLSSQAWALMALVINLSQTWLSYPVLVALAVFFIQELPPSLEDNIKDFVERLKLAISSFQVLPNVLSAPAFYMRNGYCFQRGAKHFVDSKLSIGSPSHIGKPDGQGSQDQEDLPLSSDIDKISTTSRDWNWPCFREEYNARKHKDVIRRFYPDSKHEDSHDLTQCPFTVTYLKPRSIHDLTKKAKNDASCQYIPKKIVMKLYSKCLQEMARALLPSCLKLFPKYGEIEPADLFVLYINNRLNGRANCGCSASIDGSEGECPDMFHLIRFLKKEYRETITQYERMMEAGVISWDMLWTLIVPNDEVVYYCDISNEKLCGKVLSTDYRRDNEHGDIFDVRLEVSDYNCINVEMVRIVRKIFPFKEEARITDIDVYPLEHRANSRELEEFFLIRGRKFYDLVIKQERRFMQYQGLIYNAEPLEFRSSRYGPSSTPGKYNYKENVDGRVMIDQRGFAKMNPKVSMKTAQPSRKWVQGIGFRMKTAIDESDPLLKYSPAIAYGYLFAARRWGCFILEGMSEIQFISTAFDTLVMNEDIKNTLLTLTRHHVKHQRGAEHAAINADPLPHKGKGCIILLHGPPGTGKTLTVESLAEKLECPLWQLSVPYHNRHTEELETDLLKIFEIAASWRAILVLDEADVYLSERKYSPMSADVTQTNAMTGAFLRILEYYTGILFLTTNIVDTIEPAIYSRMSCFVKYEEFNIHDRKRLWTSFLTRVGFPHPSEIFWDRVLPARFNGRVIRNIVQNAQILAQDEGCLLSEAHLRKAFEVMATPFTMSHLIESEDKSDLKEFASTTISSHAPGSVLTDSTLSERTLF